MVGFRVDQYLSLLVPLKTDGLLLYALASRRRPCLLALLNWTLVPTMRGTHVCLYDKTISELLDHEVPVQLITCRRQPTSTCTGHLMSTLDVVCALLTQPCWWYRPLDVQHSVNVPSHWLWHVRGTACRRLSGMHRRWRRSVASWRPYFFGRRSTMIRRSWLYCTV